MAKKQTVATNLRTDLIPHRAIPSTRAEKYQPPWACFTHPTESPTSLFLSPPVPRKDLLIRTSLPHRCHLTLVLQIHSNTPATSAAPMVLPARTQRRANGSTGSRAYRSTPRFLPRPSPFYCLSFLHPSPTAPSLPLAYLCTIVCSIYLPTHLRPVPSHLLGLILAVKETLYEPRFDQFCYFLPCFFSAQISLRHVSFFYLSSFFPQRMLSAKWTRLLFSFSLLCSP